MTGIGFANALKTLGTVHVILTFCFHQFEQWPPVNIPSSLTILFFKKCSSADYFPYPLL